MEDIAYPDILSPRDYFLHKKMAEQEITLQGKLADFLHPKRLIKNDTITIVRH
jgi:hypothetical protein